MSIRSNSTGIAMDVRPLLGGRWVVGFCTSPEAEVILLRAGVEIVCLLGRDGETLETAIEWLRNKPGTIAIAEDLRILGKRKADIFSAIHRLEDLTIRLKDVRDPAASHMVLLERAEKKLQSGNEDISRKTRQRRGAKGGAAKGINAAALRDGLFADVIGQRVCAHPKLNWKDRSDILGVPRSSLMRHYV